MQILLIRHGESIADLLDVHEGQVDFPLTNYLSLNFF
jgi:2,3-bisphosphoglycerate-dependent phosphoglycerate mutase